MKKIPANELIRLAMIFAEQDRQAMADGTFEETQEHKDAQNLANQFRAYRMKRWGKTQFESDMDNCEVVSVYELFDKKD